MDGSGLGEDDGLGSLGTCTYSEVGKWERDLQAEKKKRGDYPSMK